MINSLKKHFFWKFAFRDNGIFTGDLDLVFKNIKTIMHYAYLFFIVIVFRELSNVTDYQNIKMVEPVWSMFLFQGISPSVLALTFQISALIVLFGILYIPKSHLLRILFFIFFFLINSLNNSFGKINHGMHFSLMLSFFLAFIPSEKADNFKTKTILMFATAQFFLLMAYSLTGTWKLLWGIVQFFTEDVSMFSSLTLRNTIIYQFENKGPTFIGTWLLEHRYLGYFSYLIAVSIELFSLLVFFKANIQKFWGILLIILHIGIELIIGVSSFAIIMTIILLLVSSPFHKNTSLKDMVVALPIISQLRWIYNLKK